MRKPWWCLIIVFWSEYLWRWINSWGAALLSCKKLHYNQISLIIGKANPADFHQMMWCFSKCREGQWKSAVPMVSAESNSNDRLVQIGTSLSTQHHLFHQQFTPQRWENCCVCHCQLLSSSSRIDCRRTGITPQLPLYLMHHSLQSPSNPIHRKQKKD